MRQRRAAHRVSVLSAAATATTRLAPSRRPRSAFTLVEIVAALTIIVVLLGLSTLAYRTLTGSHSTAAATNLVSAMLVRARSQAMEDGRHVGVMFHLDPLTDRTMLSLVEEVQDPDSTVDPEEPLEDAYDNYKGWTYRNTLVEEDGEPRDIQYHKGHEVVRRIWHMLENRWIVRKFVCIQDHVATLENGPPNDVSTAINDPPTGNAWWGPIAAVPQINSGPASVYLDLADQFDSQPMPVGVCAQLLSDRPRRKSLTPLPSPLDRYVRTGVILFNTQGEVASLVYGIRPTSGLGQLLKLRDSTGGPVDLPAEEGICSSVGILLCDLEAFRNQGKDGDPLLQGYFGRLAPNTTAEETNEETWLDDNAVLLMVNRQDGTLVKTE